MNRSQMMELEKKNEEKRIELDDFLYENGVSYRYVQKKMEEPNNFIDSKYSVKIALSDYIPYKLADNKYTYYEMEKLKEDIKKRHNKYKDRLDKMKRLKKDKFESLLKKEYEEIIFTKIDGRLKEEIKLFKTENFEFIYQKNKNKSKKDILLFEDLVYSRSIPYCANSMVEERNRYLMLSNFSKIDKSKKEEFLNYIENNFESKLDFIIKEIAQNSSCKDKKEKSLKKLLDFIDIEDREEIKLVKFFIESMIKLTFDGNPENIKLINKNKRLLSILIKNQLSENMYTQMKSIQVTETLLNTFDLGYQDIKTLVFLYTELDYNPCCDYNYDFNKMKYQERLLDIDVIVLKKIVSSIKERFNK